MKETYYCYTCGIYFDIEKTGVTKMHELNFDKAEVDYCPYCGSDSLIWEVYIKIKDPND